MATWLFTAALVCSLAATVNASESGAAPADQPVNTGDSDASSGASTNRTGKTVRFTTGVQFKLGLLGFGLWRVALGTDNLNPQRRYHGSPSVAVYFDWWIVPWAAGGIVVDAARGPPSGCAPSPREGFGPWCGTVSSITLAVALQAKVQHAIRETVKLQLGGAVGVNFGPRSSPTVWTTIDPGLYWNISTAVAVRTVWLLAFVAGIGVEFRQLSSDGSMDVFGNMVVHEMLIDITATVGMQLEL